MGNKYERVEVNNQSGALVGILSSDVLEMEYKGICQISCLSCTVKTGIHPLAVFQKPISSNLTLVLSFEMGKKLCLMQLVEAGCCKP